MRRRARVETEKAKEEEDRRKKEEEELQENGARRKSGEEGEESEEEDDEANGERYKERSNIAKQRGLTGLPNLGNTCYMNSVLQALMNIKPFAEYFVECTDFLPPKLEIQGSAKSQSQRRLVLTLSDIFQQVWVKQARVARPHDFLREVLELNPEYRGHAQQDSQEFLRRTLDFLHQELEEEVKEEQELAGGAGIGEEGRGREGGRERGREREKTSIIWDLFKGEVCSEVRCNTCNNVSATHEPVLDQSISIPGKKARAKMAAGGKGKKAEGVKKAAAKKAAAQDKGGEAAEGKVKGKREKGVSVTCSNGSWMSSFLGIFGSGDPLKVSVTDCLHQYFGLEELEDKYMCDRCQGLQEGTKKVSLLRLPEVMTLHIKRFRFDTFMGQILQGTKISEHVHFPLQELDMGPFTQNVEGHVSEHVTGHALYDLLAVVEHRGGLQGGHYVAYVRSALDGGWYEYDDTRVEPVSEDHVLGLEGYMLFYRLRPDAAKIAERERVAQIIHDYKPEADGDEALHISRLWLLRFQNIQKPGPIDHSAFICPHSKIHVTDDQRQGKLIAIPPSLWHELVSKYGGGPKLCTPIQCGQCLREEAELNRRRDHEHHIVHQSDKTYVEPGGTWFIIDKHWLASWLAFVNEEAQGTLPGPITNDRLLEDDALTIKPNLERGVDYRGVNKEVWRIFHGIYGGGPVIERQRLDIYANPPPARSRTRLARSVSPETVDT